MDTEHFKQKLLDKQRELQPFVARLEGETRDPNGPDVGDAVDAATSDQGNWTTVEGVEIMSQTLTDVQDALRRIEDGSYGTCTVCGRQIEPARLKAVPWTPFCLEDQEREDARRSQKGIDF